MKIIPKLYKHMAFMPKQELEEIIKINSKIENNFSKGKRVVVASKEAKRYLKLIEGNEIETELDIGDSFLVNECIDMGGYNFYITLNGIKLKEDRFGFEQYFNSYHFTPESGARNVLQGIGIKFDRLGNIIK